MTLKKRDFFLLGMGLALLVGCTHPRVQKLDGTKRPPKPKNAEILVVEDGKSKELYKEIAILDSDWYNEDSPFTRKLMREDLVKEARKIGADGIHNPRVLEIERRGARGDRYVPIPGAWRQGRYEEYVMRAEAFVLVDREALLEGE